MRIIMTGTVGLDKAEYLEKVQAITRQKHRDIHLCHVGQMMYAEAPDVGAGRILDLPLSRLCSLRRSVFKDILRLADQHAQQDHELVQAPHVPLMREDAERPEI